MWLLMARKFSGEATSEELEELEDLFGYDADLQRAYTLIGSLKESEADGEEMDHDLLEKLEVSLKKEMPETGSNKSRVVRRYKIWLAAASVALVMAASWGYWQYYSGDQNNDVSHNRITTPAKDTAKVYIATRASSIILQDGTKVWLNSGSTLRCSNGFNIKEREVRLEGEAFFDVARDPGKPFIVHAGSYMEVKVLGTSFNVKAYPGDPFIETSLVSGKVAVNIIKNKNDRQIILKPHEKLTIYADNLLKDVSASGKEPAAIEYHVKAIKPNPVDNALAETSWMENKLSFNGVTFEELAYDLERIYHVKITFGDERLKGYHLTGVFSDESLNEVLHALQITTPFRYTISDKEVTIF